MFAKDYPLEIKKFQAGNLPNCFARRIILNYAQFFAAFFESGGGFFKVFDFRPNFILRFALYIVCVSPIFHFTFRPDIVIIFEINEVPNERLSPLACR
jgi:hypothetical protein